MPNICAFPIAAILLLLGDGRSVAAQTLQQNRNPTRDALTSLQLTLPSVIVRGSPIEATIRGAQAGAAVQVTVSRDLELDSTSIAGVSAGRTRFVMSRSVRANHRGQVVLAAPRAVQGSLDPMEWLWGARPRPAKVEMSDSIAKGFLRIEATSIGRDTVRGLVRLVTSRPGLTTRLARRAGLDGAFAAPIGAGPFPTVILLHGSEGGDSATAVRTAARFASQGFAALAINYFLWNSPRSDIPSGLVNIPVEMLDVARDWLRAQPEVNPDRIGVWGVSKGGEFAMVAASTKPWIRAVVGCVPSDIVWAGFGREPAAGERNSSWSLGGQSLAFVPYDRYDDALSGKLTAEIVHTRSRALYADSVAGARIPIERASAPMLLFSGERDEVWSSASMVRRIEATVRRAHPSASFEAISYANAGHGICGDGATPGDFNDGPRLPTPSKPLPMATAAASADSWRRTIKFLHRTLDEPRVTVPRAAPPR